MQETQKLAARAVAGGASCDNIGVLAGLGSGGDHMQNVERDLHTRCRGIPQYNIDTVVAEDGKLKPACVPIILPHEFVYTCWRHDESDFHGRFLPSEGPEELLKCWHNMRQHQWFSDHPAHEHVQLDAEASQCIPIRVHGDDAPLHQGSSMLVTQMSSAMSKLGSWKSRCLISVVLLSMVVPDITDRVLWETIAWSLRALACGEMPSLDEHGEPLSGWRKSAAGKRIAGPYKFFLTGILGDWKWLQEQYKFAGYYGRDRCCFKCNAGKRDAAIPAYDFRDEAAWRSHLIDHHDYMLSIGQYLASTSLPGWNLNLVMPDLMHVLFLGVLPFAVGGIMWELCLENYWPAPPSGTWQHRRNEQLEAAYSHFKVWCKHSVLSHSQNKFTVGRLGMRTLDSTPELKAKAANCFTVARWLVSVLSSMPLGNPTHQSRLCMLWGFVQSVLVLKEAGNFLTDAHAATLEETRAAALFCYKQLSFMHVNRFPLKPKIHMYDHIMRDAVRTRYNPINNWCFADEGFLKLLKAIASKCHRSVVSSRCIQRYGLAVFADED